VLFQLLTIDKLTHYIVVLFNKYQFLFEMKFSLILRMWNVCFDKTTLKRLKVKLSVYFTTILATFTKYIIFIKVSLNT